MIKIFCKIFTAFGLLVYMGMAGTSNRIYGGRPANYGEFPMMAGIYFQTRHICGGSLIGTRSVLSAAHCFTTCNKACQANRHIFVGDIRRAQTAISPRSRQIFRLKRVIAHEKYNFTTLLNDILLIELDGKVEVSVNVSVVALARQSPLVGTRCTVTGWGWTDLDHTNHSSDFLLATEVQVTDDFYCIEKMANYVPQTMICAGDLSGKNDSCRGDSGGPLFCAKGVLSGIVSFGVGCALPTYSAAYTDVSEYIDWIIKHLATIQHDDARGDGTGVPNNASIRPNSQTTSKFSILEGPLLFYVVFNSQWRWKTRVL